MYWDDKKKIYINFNQNDYEKVEEYINAIICNHNYLRSIYTLNNNFYCLLFIDNFICEKVNFLFYL